MNDQGPQRRPNFLDLPREIRDHIYSFLVTLDHGPQFSYINAHRAKTSFGINVFHLNSQIRAEAKEVVQDHNLWISLAVLTVQDQHEWGSALHYLPKHQPSVPDTLLQRKNIAIYFYIGRMSSSEGQGMALQGISFAYTLRSYLRFCRWLTMNASKFRDAVIDLHPGEISGRFEPRARSLLLNPLKTVHGFRFSAILKLGQSVVDELCNCVQRQASSWLDRCHVLLKYREVGRGFYEQGQFHEAAVVFTESSWIANKLDQSRLIFPRDFPRNEDRAYRYRNHLNSAAADLQAYACNAYNRVVDSQRGPQGEITGISYGELWRAVHCGSVCLGWFPGLSNEQLAQGHRLRGVARRNLCEYDMGQNGPSTLVSGELSKAASDLWWALEYDPGNSFTLEAMASIEQLRGQPTTDADVDEDFLIDSDGGLVLKADSDLVRSWGIRAGDGRSVLRARERPVDDEQYLKLMQDHAQ